MPKPRAIRLATLAITGAALLVAGAAPALAAGPGGRFGVSASASSAPAMSLSFGFYAGTSHAAAVLYAFNVDPAKEATTTYRIDWGDGSTPWVQTGGTVPNGLVISHDYPHAGVWKATATVDDGTSTVGQNTTYTAHYPTTPTTPGSAFTPVGGNAPLAGDLSIDGGTVDAAATKSYIVNWGDGSPSQTVAAADSGPTVVHHVFTAPRSYGVSVVTTDGIDSSAPPLYPTAVSAWGLAFSSTVNTTAFATVTVTSSAGKSLPTYSDYYMFSVNWGDGTTSPATQSEDMTHQYKTGGPYAVTVTMAPTMDADKSPAYTWTAGTTLVVPTPPPPAPPAVGTRLVQRLGGLDRIGTGITVSRSGWSSWQNRFPYGGQLPAGAVVLARSDGFSDALAGVPLAAHVNGPLLLTGGSALDLTVEHEITRVLQPHAGKTVYLLGGTAALSPAVQQRLVQLGYTVQRYSGLDRFGTALDIARRGLNDPAKIVVATGMDYPDALAAGPYASSVLGTSGHEAAVVLSQGGTLDPATAGYISSRLNSSSAQAPTVVTVGGAAGHAVDAAFPALAGHELKLQGQNRYQTANAVASQFTSASRVGVATGTGYADALTGGALAAARHFPIVLTTPAGLDPAGREAIARFWSQLSGAYLFGGTTALSDQVLRDVDAVVNATAQP
ncbi:cell wall-binding repeat-containing protein [Catenulispora acidiphila]|uniref:cell wall-binding repeat-containing protein n=1 Tax=Catenulispora acidiphila TaxID=304895 RepID=UPI00167FDEB6|nr:cell wall-binding repeat-containing protein [Catenulispora acidiphila]